MGLRTYPHTRNEDDRQHDESAGANGEEEKGPDQDFLRAMIGYGAPRLIELEVGGLAGAARVLGIQLGPSEAETF